LSFIEYQLWSIKSDTLPLAEEEAVTLKFCSDPKDDQHMVTYTMYRMYEIGLSHCNRMLFVELVKWLTRWHWLTTILQAY